MSESYFRCLFNSTPMEQQTIDDMAHMASTIRECLEQYTDFISCAINKQNVIGTSNLINLSIVKARLLELFDFLYADGSCCEQSLKQLRSELDKVMPDMESKYRKLYEDLDFYEKGECYGQQTGDVKVLSMVLPPQVKLPAKVIFISEAERFDPRSIRPGRLVVISNPQHKQAQKPVVEVKNEGESEKSSDVNLSLFTIDWLQFAVVR